MKRLTVNQSENTTLCDNVSEYWYSYGLFHNTTAPAVIEKTLKKHYISGKLHRVDGPAIYDETNNIKEFWISGMQFCENCYKRIQALGLLKC